MRTALFPVRIVAWLLAVVVALIAAAWLITLPFGKVRHERVMPAPADAALIARGAYIEKLADCSACHTAPGGKDFAGGLAIATPIGRIYTTNITPDRDTGIGRYTFGDFERAVRHGVRRDGVSLYPAMPFPSYARITTPDMQALYAYFTHSVAPVSQGNRNTDIPWPLSWRWPLTYWRWLFTPHGEEAPPVAAVDKLAARGAYIVEGPGHCGSCHTPRGLFLQEKALTATDGPVYLSGAVVDHYLAGNLRGDSLTGLGSFTEDDIVRLLQTGRTASTAVFGGMADVVSHSTQYLSAEDLHAVAHYLKSLSGSRGEPPFSYDGPAADQLAAGHAQSRGAADYLGNCAACHQPSGKGYPNTFPALAGSPVVNGQDPSSLIAIILRGAATPATGSAPAPLVMPPFSASLTDEQVADIVTFIRSSWGNRAPAVSSAQVRALRQATGTPEK